MLDKIKVRWRLYLNLALLSTLLITSFQNCAKVEPSQKAVPIGVEVTTE